MREFLVNSPKPLARKALEDYCGRSMDTFLLYFSFIEYKCDQYPSIHAGERYAIT